MFSRKRRTSAPRTARLTLEELESRFVPSGGTWTQLTNPLPDPQGSGTMLLLPDGTVMAVGGGDHTTNAWYRLTPDAQGNYVDGTWKATATMSVSRLFFTSSVLPNDKLFVLGGEYSSDGGFSATGEIYDLKTNTWTNIAPFPLGGFGDDPSELLPDGRILVGDAFGPQTEIYDPSTDSWTAGPNKLYNDRTDEESWVKLADGNILCYDVFGGYSSGDIPFEAQQYVPQPGGIGQWVDAGNAGQELQGPSDSELGPAMLLPDGRALQIGATPTLGLYTPGPTNTSPGSWAIGPGLPAGLGSDDACAAELPDGHVIFALEGSPGFSPPTTIYDFDPTTDTYTQVATPTGLTNELNEVPAFVCRMLVLPTGQMLFDDSFNDFWLYTPSDSVLASSQAKITGIASNGNGSFTLTGTQLNGVSEGSNYGDDAESAENYPLVSLTDTNGNVFYTTTSNWSSVGVQTGNTPVTVNFQEPNTVGPGAYLLTVSAAGVANQPALFIDMGAGVNDVTLQTDPTSGATEVLANGAQLAEFPQGSFTNIYALADSPTDVLTIDSSDGNPIPAGSTLYYQGDGDTATLVGPNQTNTWTLNGINSGTLNNDVIFNSVENLTGGSAEDTFVIQPNSLVTGKIDGQLGFDTLDLSKTSQGVPTGLTPGTLDGFQDVSGAPPTITGSFDNINFVETTGTHLAVTSQPANAIVGAPFGLTVEVVDANGTLNPTYNGPVTVALANNPSGATLTGTLTINTVNGVGTFSGLALNKPGNGYTLTVSSPSLPAVTTNSFNISPSTPTQIVIGIEPPGSVTAGQTFSVVAKAEDNNGFLVTSYSGKAAIQIVTNPANGTLGGTTTLNFAGGVATFNGLTLDKVGVGYTLQITSAALTPAITTPISVTPGNPAQLVFSNEPPASVVAGDNFGFALTAEDAEGNAVSNFTGTVTVGVTPNGTYPGSVHGTQSVIVQRGVATFTAVYLDLVGTGSLTAYSGNLTPVISNLVTVTAGQASQLEFVSDPPSIKAAGTFRVVVWATDSQGNLATGYNGPVMLSVADNPTGAQLLGNLTTSAVSGVATFPSLSMTTAGTNYMLLASSPSGSPPPELSPGVSTPFSVLPLLATHIGVTTEPGTSTPAGTEFSIVVSGLDQYNNVDPTFHSAVTVALSSNPTGATLTGTLTQIAGGGQAAFNDLQITAAGSGYQLEATTGSFVTTSNTFTVTASSPTQFVVSTEPSSTAVNDPITFSVTAEDQYENVVTTFSNTVKAVIDNNPGGATLSGTTTVTAANGVATFPSLLINEPGVGYTLGATSNGLSAQSSSFTIVPATAAKVAVQTQPPTTVTAGKVFGLVAQVEDQYGDVDPTYNGTVTVGFASNPGGATLGGTTTVVVHNGIAAFAGLTLNAADPGYTLQLTSGNLTKGVTTPITVNAGSATHLAVTTEPPTSFAAGNGFALTVKAEDSLGNVDPTYNGIGVTVALSNNPGSSVLGGKTTVQMVNGVANFSNLSLNVAASGYTLQLSSGGLTQAITTGINITPNSATHLVISSEPPSSVTAGAPFGLIIQAEDADGNVDPTFNGANDTVTVSFSVNAAGSTLGGTTTVQAVNGIATFTNLTLNKVGTGNLLQINNSSVAGATTSAIGVTPAAATQLIVTTQPPSPILVDGPFGFAVTAEDPFNNVVTTFNGNVTAALLNNPGMADLNGSTTVEAVNGVATFSALSVDQAGTGDTLKVTSGTLAPATTAAFDAKFGVPTTTAILSSMPNSSGLYLGPVTVTLSATDPIFKVTGTFYQIDDGPFSEYTGPFTVSGDGLHTVAYESVNSAGVQETTQTLTLVIDSTPPTTQASVVGKQNSAGYYTTTPMVTLTAADPSFGVAATYYQINNGPLTQYTGAFPVSDGVNTISYYSVDTAGYQESTHALSLKVDTTPPVTTANLTGTQGPNGTYNTAVRITFSATDNVSGVSTMYYKLNSGAWTVYHSGTFITRTSQGSTTLSYYSVDAAGNKEAVKTTTFKIDTVPPALTVKATAVTSTNETNVPITGMTEVGATVSIMVTDKNGVTAIFSATVNSKGSWSASFNAVADNLADGPLTITVTATDGAGNHKVVTVKTTKST